MTRLCCPSCRLRFTGASAASDKDCPQCGAGLEAVSAQGALGYRLADIADPVPAMPLAAEVALPVEFHRPQPLVRPR